MNDRRRQDEDFVKNVLERTSGSPCQRATILLPGLVDQHLEDLDRQLVQAHLEHCEGCRAVAVTLGWLGTLLPDMAILDPGPDFTALVVARTTGEFTPAERAARAGIATGPAGLVDRLGRWWQRQILKPQFALQFAYVATVVLVLLTALPISPFRGTPEKALQAVQAGPGAIPMVGSAQQWVDEGSRTLFGRLQGGVQGQWQILSEDLDGRQARSQESRDQLGEHFQQAVGRVKSGEFGEAGYELIQAARSGRSTWRSWWHNEINDEPKR